MKTSTIIRLLSAGLLTAQATAIPFNGPDGAHIDPALQRRQDAQTAVPTTEATAPIQTPSPTTQANNNTSTIPPPTSPSVQSAPTRPADDTRSPPPSTVTAARAAMTPYLYGCDKDQKAKASQAWKEAGQLADAHSKWKPPGWFNSGSYQSAMDMYLGTDSRNDDPWFGTGPLKQNINRQQGIHNTNEDWSPYWSYVYIYCDESKVPAKDNKPKEDECKRPNQPGKKVVAYTFPDDGTIFGWNAKYVVLCPRFFEDDILTLEQQTTNAQTNDTLKKVIDPWRKVKARSMFHETYHWGPAEVSDPVCDRKPEIYDPSRVVEVAKAENTNGARTNAESWAQAAVAMYVQQTFKLNDPPKPKSEVSSEDLGDLGDFEDDIEEKFFDAAPDWFESPVKLDADNFSPSGDGVEIMDV